MRPRRRGLHHVAAEAIHQTRRIEVQQQTDVDAAHADGRVNPRVKRPTGTRPVAGSSGARPTGHLGPVTELHLMDWQDGGDGFDLQDKLVGDDDIRLEASPTGALL